MYGIYGKIYERKFIEGERMLIKKREERREGGSMKMDLT
jgi:hypothetical protein